MRSLYLLLAAILAFVIPAVAAPLSNTMSCDPIFTSVTFTICPGDSVMIHATWRFTAGTYTDLYYTPMGCDSTVASTVILYEPPTVALTLDWQCDYGLFWANASGAEPLLYVWDNEADTTGDYYIWYDFQEVCYLTVIDANGCDASDSLVFADLDWPWDCPGDYDNDGIVGVPDLVMLISNYGIDDPWCFSVNLDENSEIGVADLMIFMSLFGNTCP